MTLTGIRGLFACKDVAIPWRQEYLGHCQNIGLCPYYFLPETKHDAIQGIILVTRWVSVLERMPTVLVRQPSVFMEITLYTVKLDNMWELKLTCPSKEK